MKDASLSTESLVTSKKSERLDSIIRDPRVMWFLVAVFLLAIVCLLISFFLLPENTPLEDIWWLYLSRHLGLSLLLFLVVGLLVEGYVEGFIRRRQISELESIRDELGDVQLDIEKLADDLAKKSQTLQNMLHSDAEIFYQTRAQAANDIEEDLVDDSITYINISGISLKEFLSQDDPSQPLSRAWTEIQSFVCGETPRAKPLRIRLLLVNPESNAAYLRSLAESEHPLDIPVLTGHVREAIERLVQLPHEMNNVCLQVRLYCVEPIMFLVQTDRCAYVQPYFFQKRLGLSQKSPIIEYRARPGSPSSLHDYYRRHFEFIWSDPRASIALTDYERNHVGGPERALREANVANAYYDPVKAANRMARVIEDEDRKLYLIGISLHSFFRPGHPLGFTLLSKQRAGKLNHDVRVLVLNPLCCEARFRSFREVRLEDPNLTLHRYTLEPHKQGDCILTRWTL